MMDVREAGAVGDGRTDDTQALRAAIARVTDRGGVVHLPPGRYRTDTLELPSHVTLRGEGGWSYRDPGATVLLPMRAEQSCLIDLSLARGARITDLALHGELQGERMHGIAVMRPRKKPKPRRAPGTAPASRADRIEVAMSGASHLPPLEGEQNIVIDNCWISLFTGSGIHLQRSHVWCVRHSLVTYNGVDGIDGHNSADAWIIDNQIGFNARYGLHIGSSTTVTANRIEQNDQAGLKFNDAYVEDDVVTGNHFCSNRGTGIELIRGSEDGNLRGITLTGNHLRNSGCAMTDDPDRCCHIRMANVSGVACTGNMLHALRASNAPTAALVIQKLTDCVITGNSFHKAATREMIRDLGGHSDLVIRDNPGRIKQLDDERA